MASFWWSLALFLWMLDKYDPVYMYTTLIKDGIVYMCTTLDKCDPIYMDIITLDKYGPI